MEAVSWEHGVYLPQYPSLIDFKLLKEKYALDKIDAFAVGMSEASHIFKNTFRELFNKKAKDYSKIDKRIKMSELFKKPWMAKQSI